MVRALAHVGRMGWHAQEKKASHGRAEEKGEPVHSRRTVQRQSYVRVVAFCSRVAPRKSFRLKSHRSDLNRRPLDYESRALPLSYGGGPRTYTRAFRRGNPICPILW